ncbi:cytochrome P450, partial [Acephala macrosclerotiorum]
LPPGPKALPLLGNYLSLPRKKPWLQFTEWAKVHGPIYTLYTGLTPRLVISDPQIAYKLLSERSNKYSSRPRLVMLAEIYSPGSVLAILPYGPAWSLRRKILHQFLRPSALQEYKARQEAEASRLLSQIIKDEGEQWREAIERYISSVVFTLSYGRRIDTLNSEVYKKRKYFLRYAAQLIVPGAYLVEAFPFLNYLPDFLARWKIPVREMGRLNAEYDISLVNVVKQDIKTGGGKASGSLTENMLLAAQVGDEDLKTLLENPHHIAGLPASLFAAGSSTTISSLSSAILGLILHPWVFISAQQEIDSIVGKSRSPAFSDREKLPYIEALVKETLRWKTTVPIGLAHALSEDDIYEGYHIPKGTVVTANQYAMNHDPSYFPSPSEFAPERFLSPNDPRFRPELQGNEFPGRYGHASFGFGRRICVGSGLAINGIWIALAKIIWAFDLMAVEGENYEGVDTDGDIIAMLKPFKCRWRPRSREHMEVVERELGEAEGVLE